MKLMPPIRWARQVPLLLLCVVLFLGSQVPKVGARQDVLQTQPIMPGDTWAALALRYGADVETLKAANPHPNLRRQPVIGDSILIPAEAVEQTGQFWRSEAGGLLAVAVAGGLNPWQLAWENELRTPHSPLLGRPILLPGEVTPREWPQGMEELVLSHIPALPGKAMGVRARAAPAAGGPGGDDLLHYTGSFSITLQAAGLEPIVASLFTNQEHLSGLVVTGAFYPPGDHELAIQVAGQPLWSQPWRMVDDEWTYDQLTLTGEAAQIDAQSIAEERARLSELWAVVSATPQWESSWQYPIEDYLTISSLYGARRSYNGGPYRSYHEGLDFSAYGGTPVYASARGTVVLAEQLYVRGGAVIIDHGLGIFSGVYHLSAVHASPGQVVEQGDLLGEVGSSGLSTGNHLHWELLVGGTWVDPADWLERDMACWILAAWESECARSVD